MQRGGDRRSAGRVTKETNHNKSRRYNAADPPRRKGTHGSGSNAHSRTRRDSDSSSSSSLIATHVVASRNLRNTLRSGENRESGTDSNSESHSDGSNQGQRHATSRAISRGSNHNHNHNHTHTQAHTHKHNQTHGRGHGQAQGRLQRSSDRDDDEEEDNDDHDHDHDDEDHDPSMDDDDDESRSDASNADGSDLRNASDDLSRGDDNDNDNHNHNHNDDNDNENENEAEVDEDEENEIENENEDHDDEDADADGGADEDEIDGGDERSRAGQSRPSVMHGSSTVKRTPQTKGKYAPSPSPTPSQIQTPTLNSTPALNSTPTPTPTLNPPPMYLAPPPGQARASAGFTGASGANQRFTLSTEVMEARIQITPRVHGRFDSLPPHPRMLLHKGCLLRVGHCLRLHRHPSCFVIVGFDMHTPDAPLLCRKLSARTGSAAHIPSTPGSVPIPADEAAAPRLAGSTAADYALDSKPELYVIPLRIVVSVLPGIFLLRFADLAYVRPANIPSLQSPPLTRQHPNSGSASVAAASLSAANQPGKGVSIDGFLIEEIP